MPLAMHLADVCDQVIKMFETKYPDMPKHSHLDGTHSLLPS